MQGQYQPRAPGIAAGQSNRTTTATYFDYQGVMRTAQPRELRPNFVYQNGVWVQDGWLREGAASNVCTDANEWVPSLSSSLISIDKTTDPAFPGCIVWKMEGTTSLWGNITVTSDIPASSPGSCISIHVKNLNGMPLYIQTNNGNSYLSYNGSTPEATSDIKAEEVGGGWWKIFMTMKYADYIPGTLPYVKIGLNGNNDVSGTVYGTAVQTEDNASSPSSWIPYGQTRDAD